MYNTVLRYYLYYHYYYHVQYAIITEQSNTMFSYTPSCVDPANSNALINSCFSIPRVLMPRLAASALSSLGVILLIGDASI